ncbi:ABC transporter substrate-binding protein [Martelella mediterranea]|uniref:Carbohydrate ABC transporter substrate-binding protein (CUT1 family) n=1 Tax=Martelella mediterranea TaxID=293089 RepID=A0A4R3NHU4_9HYPH|nr:sugar ABC transporter substrate-binding protein [Martelella mediterranea]TCT33037.1 carbohydrate ABC transporter substrate-binding protein (CUT1 family) [Martelella mediterranea]
MRLKTLLGGVAALALAVPGLAQAETFSLWVRSDGSEFMPTLVEAFNAKGKDKAELQIVPVNELVQKYAIAAAGGSEPDALSLDLIYTPSFAQAGQLKDMTEFAKSLPYYDQLSKAHLTVGTYDGKIYGMPFSADASVLVWNKNLFEEAGLDPDKGPSTWKEIREDAAAVGAIGDDTYGFYFSGNCGGCNIFTFTPLIWASGGNLFEDEGAKATVDTPQMKAAIEFYRGMVKDGLVPAGSQTDAGSNFFAAFAGGNIGITPSGSFAIGALNNQYPDLEYGVTYLPGEDGGWSSFAGGDNIVVSVKTEEEKMPAIKAFIEFAYSAEGQKILAQNGSLPVRRDVAEQALEGLDARYMIAADAMDKGRTPYSPVFNDLINSRNGPWVTMLNKAFYADSAEEVQDAIDEAQNEMQSIIDSSR